MVLSASTISLWRHRCFEPARQWRVLDRRRHRHRRRRLPVAPPARTASPQRGCARREQRELHQWHPRWERQCPHRHDAQRR